MRPQDGTPARYSERDGRIDAIHNEEVAALLREDFDGIAQLRTKLQAAREHKASLIELYREHVTSHGC